MAITFVAQAHSDTGTGTEPSGAASGDYIFALVTSGSSSSHSNPGGWTQIGTSVVVGSTKVSLWSIVRGGSAPSYAFGPTSVPEVETVAYRGADPTLNASAQSANGS